MKAEHIPVIVGVGEVTQRNKDPLEIGEPLALMEIALRAAEEDCGAKLVPLLNSLDVVCEHSWPYADAPALLSEALGIDPAHRAYAPAGGESPVRLIHEAALRITRGECQVAAVVGAESSHAVAAATKVGIRLPWRSRDAQAKLLRGADICHPLAVRHGVVSPANVYPFYENATLAAWRQTPAEAHAESAQIWAGLAKAADLNPHAWSRTSLSADEIATPSPTNRLIAWPYTLRMVANPLVNMGAAVLLTSLARARELGIHDSKMIHVVGGASAAEPRDYLAREHYHGSPAQDAVLRAACEIGGVDAASAFDATELYSCFPVVPKMARRALGLPADALMTATGGLSFFGAPLNNYMTHAAAGLARALRLRQKSGDIGSGRALLYGQGEFVTKHHALVLSSTQPQEPLTQDYSVQALADRARGPAPTLAPDHNGSAQLETHTIVYGREGEPEFGVVIARTPRGQRLMARVTPSDTATLAVLTNMDHSPVGRQGVVHADEDDLLHWRFS